MPCYAWAEDPRADQDEPTDHDEPRWTLSGTLNRAFLVWDDGEQQGVHSVDNPQDSTGFLLEGEFGSEGWTSGFTIGLDTYHASADSVDQLDWDGDGAVVELPYAFAEFGNERWGEIEVGHTDSATDEIDNFNLAEADAVADASVDDWINRFFLRAANFSGDAGLASGLPGAFNAELGDHRWGDFIDGKLAGESGRFITYRSPLLEGFELSAALGQPQEVFFLNHGEFLFSERENGVFADAALRYANDLGPFRVEGGVGAWRDTTEDFDATEPTEDTGAAGSLGVRHMPTGLNIAVSYGAVSHTDKCEEPGALSGECRGNDSSLYLKGGIVRDDITRLGQTAIYGEYHRNWQGNNDSDEDLIGTLLGIGEDEEPPPAELRESSVSVWGAGIVQQVEPVHPQIDDMQLYLGYRHYDLDFDVLGANAIPRRDIEDIDVVMLGLTVHWGGTREPEELQDTAGEDAEEDGEPLAFFEPPEFEGGAPVYDWSGLYVGTQTGYFDIDSDGFFATSVDLSFCGGGFLSGAQVGWNMQRGSWVFGAEPDFAFFDCEETNLREEHYVAETDFLATFRARVGWARDNVLLFATAGPAFLHASVKTSLGGLDEDQQGNEDSRDASAFGAAVGGGIEWGITRNLSIKAEGLYLFLDRRVSLAELQEGCTPGDEGCLDSAENFFSVGDGFLFRVGANWRLWSETGEASPYGQRPAYLPVVDQLYDWSGFHVGTHVGYGEADSGGVYRGDRQTNPPPPDPSHPAPIALDFESRGLLTGGQAGYDWQSGAIVAGVETDISAVDWDDVITDVQIPSNPAASTLDLDLLSTARARVGWAINDWLFYVTGGVGFLQGEFRDITLSDGIDVFAIGGVAGGGIEWGLARNLSFKAEGLYLAFDEAVDLANLGAGVTGDQLEIGDSFAFRLGANWRPWQSGIGDSAAIIATNGEPAPAYDWSGIYGGLHVGFGGLTTDGIYNSSPLPSGAIDLTGVADVGALGGGQVGFNYQKNWMVLGVEADVAALDWRGKESEFADLNDVMTFTSKVLPTVRGRVGWAEDDLLFYLTGGLTFVDAELDNTRNDGGRSKDIEALGGVAGLGMEWGVTRNLSLKTEGLFLGIDERIDIRDIGTEGDPGDFFVIDDGFVARLGANWRFNPSR